MGRKWRSVGAALAVALTVTLVWLGLGVLSDDQSTGDQVAAAASPGVPEPAEPRGHRGRVASGGHGPPPWAHGPDGVDRPGKVDGRGWSSTWRSMSPRARERTMTRLAEEHAAGMRAWAACHAAGRDDCDKPLPPGLAKKQLRR